MRRTSIAKPPTRRQRAIFCWIVEYFAANMRTPTLREIGKHFNIGTPNGVVCAITALRRRGLLANLRDGCTGFVIADLDHAVQRRTLSWLQEWKEEQDGQNND